MPLFDSLPEAVRREFESKRDTLPRELIVSHDAAARLARALRDEIGGRRATVLFDRRTRAAAGEACVTALKSEGFVVVEHLIPGSSPVCDDVTEEAMRAALPASDVLVAVGSGVVNDLTKWSAAQLNVPYVVFATAASMNGYSAANVAPAIRGVKSLFRARAPRLIAGDPRVIANAPFELTASGLGDVIAKPVSTADWIMNHHLFGEGYSSSVAAIIDDIELRYTERPEGIARRDEDAIMALFEALVLSGCAMTLQGSSLPASGGEHLVSHALDMMSHLDRVPHDLHGRQVGVATILAAELYTRVFAMQKPRFELRCVPFDPRVWGTIAPAVEEQHREKEKRVAQAVAKLPSVWTTLRAEMQPKLRRAEAIKECLSKAGAAHRISDIGCTRERFLTAVEHGGAIRGRFTSLDLAYAAGILPDAAGEIVDRLLT